MESSTPTLNVVIVGGGIAGLTLAHCLLKNGINFVVLESRGEVHAQDGAALGMLPNGARILDQLGIFDDLIEGVQPLRKCYFWSEDGELIAEDDSPVEFEKRHGYCSAFMDRQRVLEKLYSKLGDHRDRVLVNKKTINVENLPDGIRIHCADGSVYEGDLVVGADGVRSIVRQSMWKSMDEHGLQAEVEKEKTTMISEYNCIFGIAPATPGLNPGEIHRTYGQGYSFLAVIGKEGRVWWFLFTKMSRKYNGSEIPRFKQSDMDEHVLPYLSTPVTRSVRFSEIYERAFFRNMLALEESLYKHWFYGRMVCIGDSVHKMTPNMGQGANSAIENCAMLANYLAKLTKSPACKPEDIRRCLQGWQTTVQPRISGIWYSACDLTRLETKATLKHKVLIYLLPYLLGIFINKSSALMIGAAKLDCSPPPARSQQGTVPFKDLTPSEEKRDSGSRGIVLGALLVGFVAVGWNWRRLLV
ncbi:uncharacterized protein N7498_006170 [Penicillium cinerascens]|uniref:FAD-binding domain-containing protein n=1 Tax=Penicillium cinerascens TaxID=70096 RepID=A0A9W9MHR0_9EURO|nr:uncharacterized protein N7498_006170 [Penicillium cinerascens]KAJ5201507.1 hypothetical protein N7498_006170 [Penicillium cinerascens]